MAWRELVFMMVILKIPVVYVCVVVYWAIKAEPRPFEGAARPVSAPPGPEPGWGRRRPDPRGPRVGPHGSPTRTYPRTRRAALARAEAGR